MKTITAFLTAVLVLCSFGVAQSKEEKKSVSQVLDGSIHSVEGEFVSAAEAMPADKYDFAPTNGEFKGVRTFAQQIKHVATINYMIGAAILGEKPPIEIKSENGPDNLKSKADIVKFLKDSFAYAHKSVATITETNFLDPIPAPWGKEKTTRLALASTVSWHSFDHYGQMVEYLRMNDIVPPASRG